MSIPFFSCDERTRVLLSVAREWEGTPFHAHGRHKHVGVDCVWLVAEALRECGLPVPERFPAYSVGAGSHLEASLVSAFVVDSGLFERVVQPSGISGLLDLARPGDVLGFKIGRVVHHVGIKLDGEHFLHARQPLGVSRDSLRGPVWARTLHDIWRPIEP